MLHALALGHENAVAGPYLVALLETGGPVDGETIRGVVAGPYTDATGNKGSATYDYQVCETGGTSACSNTVTVVF